MSRSSSHSHVRPAAQPSSLDALWVSYVEAARLAQNTLLQADGIAAGRAWAAWLNAFAAVPVVEPGVLPQPMRRWS